MSEVPLKIFAYGTLMRGYKNHPAMKNCRFLGRASTVEKYAMFSIDYPYVNSKLSEVCIQGEVYEVVDEETLSIVDEIEGHPVCYCRTPIKVKMQDSGEVLEASIYFNDLEPTTETHAESIASGNFHDSRIAPLRRSNWDLLHKR